MIADTYVTVRGERSKFFGPDAGYSFRGNGTTANNLNSDFFFKQIIAQGTIEKLVAQKPPLGPVPADQAGRPRLCRAATTTSCAAPASRTSPTRRAAARSGCGRSR